MTETFIQHCTTLYEALEAVSVDKEADGQTVKVFAGKVTEVFKTTGIAQTYYSPTLRTLERSGALLKIQRGGRNADTVYVLKGLPEVWDAEGWKGEGTRDLTSHRKYDRLAAEVRDINNLLGGMNVPSALTEIEQRLVAIESRLTSLEV